MRRLVPALLLASCSNVFASDSFDFDAHGWGLEGQTFEIKPRLDKIHGDPTGNLCASDRKDVTEDRPWRFVGSTAYTGDAVGFFGRTVTWEATTTNAQFILVNEPAIFIESGIEGIKAPPMNGVTAGTQWTKLFVALDTSSTWTHYQTDAGERPATEEDIKKMLGDIDTFRIRGEWSRDPEESCIDNIVFGAR